MPDAPGKTTLARTITGPLLFLFILGDVLGAGIYALVGKVAGRVGGAVWAPLLLALAFAMLTACSYAELVSRYPHAGGAATFAARAYRQPVVTFLVGYCMLAAAVTSAAGLALAFAGDYLGAFVRLPPIPTAMGFLLVLSLLNARGVRESLAANVGMTVIEVTGLLLVALLAGVALSQHRGDVMRTMQFASNPLSGTFGAALLAFYSFVGFEVSANMAEEIIDVRRNYPRALFAALGAAGVVYVLVALAASSMLPTDQLAASTAPLLDVVRATSFGVPARLFGFVALVAVSNGALLTMVMASRLTYGMAEQGVLPAPFTRLLPNRQTPWVAIVATTAVAMALTATGSLATLAETVVLLLLLVFLSTNAALLVLRREPADGVHFRAPRAAPWLAIASCVALLSQQQLGTWLRALVLLGVGGGLYALGRVRSALAASR